MIKTSLEKRRFNRLRQEFASTYQKLKKLGPEPFVIPFWQGINEKIEAAFLPVPSIDFLNEQAIKDTMLVNGSDVWLNTQVKFLSKRLGADLKKLARESVIGRPPRLGAPLDYTSHNKLHHLYHLLFYLDKTGNDLTNINTVVEWGGGYGNLVVLWQRLKSAPSTYIIIDTALFCSLQFLYLATVLGDSKVHLLKTRRDKIIEGKVNIVPLALLDKLDIKGDLFISTWGLSESSDQAQDYVVKQKKWFACPYLLIGYQDKTKELTYASRLGKLAAQEGAKIIDIKFLPNNHYAIR